MVESTPTKGESSSFGVFSRYPKATVCSEDLVNSPNGFYLFVADDLGPRLIDLRNGMVVIKFGLSEPISSAFISSDGKRLYLGHPDGWLRVLDAHTGEKVNLHLIGQRPYMASRAATKIFEVFNGKAIAVGFGPTASEDESTVIFDTESGNLHEVDLSRSLFGLSEDRLTAYHYFFGPSLYEIADTEKRSRHSSQQRRRTSRVNVYG